MKDYNRVLELGYDRLAIIYNNIGYVYYERGHFPDALQNFNKSIELCPHHVRAYYNRSTVWEEVRDWKKAISDYDAILAINPKVYDAYYFRSRCHTRLLNWKEAVKDCLYSLTNNRSHTPSLSHLYQLLLESGDIDALSSKFEKFEKMCKYEYDLLCKSTDASEAEIVQLVCYLRWVVRREEGGRGQTTKQGGRRGREEDQLLLFSHVVSRKK
jgi:tetratricopeptide (TPR) repeat protein